MRFGAHFVVGGILYGMVHEDEAGICHAECVSLRYSGVVELARCDGNGWEALDFKPDCVVHTARRTRPSVS